jgi:hypothetical protein
LSNVVAIACGANHNLALKSDHTIVAWGNDSRGQSQVPAGLTNMMAIAAGANHSLALAGDGQVRAWGWNAFGLTQIPAGLSNVTAISAGAYHCLALTRTGNVIAWGSNASGQTNVPAGLSDIVALASGAFHSLALKADGTVVAWGSNTAGQALVPAGLSNVTAIACGGDQSFALELDGTLVSWGDNSFQQTAVPGGLVGVQGIAAGLYHSLAWFHGSGSTSGSSAGASPNPLESSPPAASPPASTAWNPVATGGQNVPPLPIGPGQRARVACAEYPAVSYDLYLPPDYSTNKPPLPLFITLNPNGGGMVGDFLTQASELGIILVGIYESQDGQAMETRIDAFIAVWRDLRQRLHYNPAAVFVGGFSGGGWNAYDLAKVARPFVTGVLPIAGWLGNQYGPTDRFLDDLLVARATGASDAGAVSFLDPDADYLHSYGVLLRDWMFPGGHEMPLNQLARECLAWLIDQSRPALPFDKLQAEAKIAAWRQAAMAGDGERVLRECVQSILVKPRTYEAHYAQIMLDELEADFESFQQFDVSGLASGDDAQDLFFFGAFGGGRLASLKHAPPDRYYSSLKALTGIGNTSDNRHDDIIWCLQNYGFALNMQSIAQPDGLVELKVHRDAPFLAYSVLTSEALAPSDWKGIESVFNVKTNDTDTLVVPAKPRAQGFFKLNAQTEPNLGLPEDSTGPGNVAK